VSATFMRRLGVRGLTLIELLIAVLLVTLIFGIAYQIMDQARRESRKGFWLQKAITELRNGTRALAIRLKKTSYPTTMARTGSQQVVVSYKEKRTFDESGRLRNLVVKSSTSMNLSARSGTIRSSADPVRLMLFPMCIPEMDLDSYVPGVITWVEIVLEPDKEFAINGLSRIVICERNEVYDTRSLPDRAYSLNGGFNRTLTVANRKTLIGDVDQVRIDVYSMDELSGVHVTKTGTVGTTTKKKFLVSIRVECMNPVDKTMVIGDQCSVTIHTDANVIP